MAEDSDKCSKCGGDMEPGFLLDSSAWVSQGRGRPLAWVEARQVGLVTRVRPADGGQVEVDAYRCVRCGFLELYSGIGNAEA